MNLTPHFTLAELVRSSTADRLGLDNTPPDDVVSALRTTAEMLERIRLALHGVPVIVTSGYRSPDVNRAVGGVSSSDHQSGQAADFIAPRFGPPFAIASKLAPLVSLLNIEQLILEGVKGKQWVHVSTRRPSKVINRIITITDAGARVGIQALG
ncbi:MAG: peptidase M15A [Hydrogenophaga sp.]|uniref:D-Ala-D-Ala carboxypeptidase family metallohydrolase n=1 Tax=Hydrogenophaga sp. TaxID=1904254 RepID=UPI001D752A43|nr:D-Ala-D-Ala carboxypeptidase family metallohydrolase [Hydrogenophaga sp.]MBX3610408.1 peptidase M15A [Hydrogenophaga sp.]